MNRKELAKKITDLVYDGVLAVDTYELIDAGLNSNLAIYDEVYVNLADKGSAEDVKYYFEKELEEYVCDPIDQKEVNACLSIIEDIDNYIETEFSNNLER